jgi:hypothetical protein
VTRGLVTRWIALVVGGAGGAPIACATFGEGAAPPPSDAGDAGDAGDASAPGAEDAGATTDADTKPSDGGGSSTRMRIACGEVTCDVPEACCIGVTSVCSQLDDDCAGYKFACDDPSDCEDDEVCCAEPTSMQASCSAACPADATALCVRGAPDQCLSCTRYNCWDEAGDMVFAVDACDVPWQQDLTCEAVE